MKLAVSFPCTKLLLWGRRQSAQAYSAILDILPLKRGGRFIQGVLGADRSAHTLTFNSIWLPFLFVFGAVYHVTTFIGGVANNASSCKVYKPLT